MCDRIYWKTLRKQQVVIYAKFKIHFTVRKIPDDFCWKSNNKFIFYLSFSVTEKANILSNIFKLKDRHITIENPLDINLVKDNSPVVWSNYKHWKVAETEWVAKYVLKERPHTDPNHYIKQFVYGIIEASTTLNYTYTTIEVVETVINGTDLLNDTNILNGTTYGLNDTSLPIINVTYGK